MLRAQEFPVLLWQLEGNLVEEENLPALQLPAVPARAFARVDVARPPVGMRIIVNFQPGHGSAKGHHSQGRVEDTIA